MTISGVSAYPLAWPDLFRRSASRTKGVFKTELNKALHNVRNELFLFGKDSGKPVADIVISSNVTLGEQRPGDPGVAVWFTWDGMPVCIPVDRYDTVEANLQAIYHVLHARRTEMRHGTLEIVRATMRGFVALPPPPGRKAWRDVLKIAGPATAEAIQQAHRALAKSAHPDHGGTEAAMQEINDARDRALREIGAK